MIGERNLAPERGPSVWNRVDPGRERQRNRWVEGLRGAAMAAAGAALVAAGGTRVFRALSSKPPAAGPERSDHERDAVGFESSQSFPASDAPSWTPVHGPAPRDTRR